METTITVDNLKCGGCASTITKKLKEIAEINSVNVLTENGQINITHSNNLNIQYVKDVLHHLGYPETGTTEGLDKLTSNVKSYVSCAIGRLNPVNENKKAEN